MMLNTLLIIDDNNMLGELVEDYCELNYQFSSVQRYNSFSEVSDILSNSTLVLINSTRLRNDDEIISMSQCIRNHSVPVLIYSRMEEPELNHIIDAIELGAIDVIPASLFTRTDVSPSELATCAKLIQALQEGYFQFDIELLRNRLYPLVLDKDIPSEIEKIRSITIVGCDVGGISSVLGMIPQLPSSYTTPICVLMNGAQRMLEALGDRLEVNSALSIKTVNKDTYLEPSTVYIVPTNKAPLLDAQGDGKIKILLNNAFPFELSLKYWIDPFMFSAADIFGENTVGILLGGIQTDGIMGLEKIKKSRGTTIIQSKKSCFFQDRFRLALESGCAKHSVYIGALGETLLTLDN